MRPHNRISSILMAFAVAMAGVLAVAASAQQPGLPAKPKPYKPVAVKLPQPVQDPTFEAFRKQLAGVAERKDRAGLARLIAKNFFWIPEGGGDIADKGKPPIEVLTRAIGLDSPDGTGWEILGSFAVE